jgi:hypothetical protein
MTDLMQWLMIYALIFAVLGLALYGVIVAAVVTAMGIERRRYSAWIDEQSKKPAQ